MKKKKKKKEKEPIKKTNIKKNNNKTKWKWKEKKWKWAGFFFVTFTWRRSANNGPLSVAWTGSAGDFWFMNSAFELLGL